ncbi:MAG: outer membrane protein TolC [Paraglaciecola sp.]|jgi:outer membrane protein TolC
MKLKISRLFLGASFSIIFLNITSLNASQTPTNLLSFSDAWTLLQKSNNSLAAQHANVERYKYLQEGKKDLNLPAVTLGANYTRLNDDITLLGSQISESLAGLESTFENKDVYTSSVRVIWPIYTGGKISAAQNAAKGQFNQAEAELDMETQHRFEDLSQYYFSVLLAQDVLKTRLRVETGLKQHLDFAIKLEEQGQVAHIERLQAEASLDKAQVDYNKAKKDLDIASSALTQILNQNVVVLPKDTLFINSTLPLMSSFIEKTLSTYPGLEILDSKKKQASSLIAAEKSKYYPDVFLFGDYNLYEEDTLTSELKPDWFVGIGLSVPLFDNSGRSNNVKAAHSAVYQVQYLKAQAQQDLTLLVQKTYLEAQQAIEEVIGLDSSLALARENLRLRKKGFTQGLSNSLDVVDAELNQSSIKTQQSVARFQYLTSLTKLLALSGEMNTFKYYQNTALPTDIQE